MALLYVLWAGALAALLVGGFVDASTTALAAARGASLRAEAQAAADGALALGLLAVLQGAPGTVSPGVRAVRLPWGEAALAIADEGGRIDLNRAPPAVLEALFRAAGAPEALAAAVVARRAAIATETRPAFALPDALGQVPGVSAALWLALRDAITTVSQSEVVDPATAGALALLAASGLSEPAVAAFIAERPRLGRLARPRGVDETGRIGPLTGAGFTLTAEARAGDTLARRALVLRPVPFAGRTGAAIVDWHRPAVP